MLRTPFQRRLVIATAAAIAIGFGSLSTLLANGPQKKCRPDLAAWSCKLVDGRAFLQAVSIAALLAQPDRFDGLRLTVTGIVSTDLEDHSVYLDELSYRYSNQNNAISLVLSPDLATMLGKVSGSVVGLAGMFQKGPCGHFGATVGCLVVERFWEAQTREQSKAQMQTDPGASKGNQQH